MKRLLVLFSLILTAGCSGQQFGLMGQEQIFGQKADYVNKVDVLWVVDNSNSMSSHQQKIAEQVGVFINALNGTGMDYHIGVTTMDCGSTGAKKGRLISSVGTPKVLTRNTPNMLSILQSRLQMGDGGSATERALEAVKLALSSPNADPGGYNDGFRRPEALLAVVVLSNEDDESGSGGSNMISFLDSKSSASVVGEKLWVVNFIGTTPNDPTCMTVPWTREDGLAYMNLADHSGGAVASICSGDFRAAIANIQGRILSLITEYRFNRRPDPATIQVWINGRSIPQGNTNGWTYQPDRQSLQFHGNAVPPIDSIIRVEFAPEGFSQ